MLAKNLFRQASCFFKRPVLPYNSLLNYNVYNFSEFFRERDKAEWVIYEEERTMNKQYKTITNRWQKPLERKRLRRERKAILDAQKTPPEPEPTKLVVHDPVQGIQIPAPDNGIFAIVQIGGSQFKVLKDDVVICDQMPEYDINEQIMFEKVYMIGTKDYTSLGRPIVEKARVYATVEEQTISEKVIVFKKKRRKGYKRTNGAKQPLTVLRIDKIEHEITQETMERAVSLV